MNAWPENPVLVEVWRGGVGTDVLESVHRGALVVLGADGAPLLEVGDVARPVLPRSSNKPVQATALLAAGWRPRTDGELAVGAASHNGEDGHVELVRSVLTAAGLTPDDLQCPPDLPMHEASRRAALVAGTPPAPLYMNCSGKHAAMLTTCVRNGWPTATYRDPGHPLQVAIRRTVEELAGERVGGVAVDGCGAPLFGITLTGLARAFRAIALAEEGSVEHWIRTAVHAYPEWVGGTGSDVARLLRALPGAVAKDGAEGVHAIGLPDGRAVALKIADGSARPRSVVMVAALRRLGVTSDALDALAAVPVLGHGAPVGAVLPTDAVTKIM